MNLKQSSTLLLGAAMLFGSFTMTSCDQRGGESPSQNEPVAQESKLAFNGTESDPIDLNLAATWTQRYQEAFPGEIVSHYTGSDMVGQLLNQSTAMGIRFYRGLDEDGNRKILLMAADQAGNDLEGLVSDFTTPCPAMCYEVNSPLFPSAPNNGTNVAFDQSAGAPIALAKAQSWMQNYQQVYPNGVWGHFFGNQILSQLLMQNGAVGIRIYYAIGDAEEETLILVAVDANGHDMVTGLLAEFSNPCPPACKTQ